MVSQSSYQINKTKVVSGPTSMHNTCIPYFNCHISVQMKTVPTHALAPGDASKNIDSLTHRECVTW